jgi:hypothetical protein
MAVSAGAINIMVLKKGYKAWIRIVNLNPGTSTPFIADLESSR